MTARLAVVVASPRSLTLLADTIAALRPQCARLGAPIVVARAAGTGPEAGDPRFEGVTVVAVPPGATLPELRGAGLAGTDAEWVALTEDNCVPDAGWCEAFLGAVRPGQSVVGGGMGNALTSRAVDWAAFFSEYGFYSSHRPRDVGHLVTDASVLYGRSVVGRVSEWARAGSWEDDIHRRLAAAGEQFGFAPAAVVRQNEPQRFVPFCANRFDHGRQFASVRTESLGWPERWVRALTTPLLPAVLLTRVARAAAAENRGAFLRSMPLTFAFLAAWAVGECVGYLGGRRHTS